MSPKSPNEVSLPLKDSSHLYPVERRARHAERPGFRIGEIQISREQEVPWHYHNNINDTFYVLQGQIRIQLQNPTQVVDLDVGSTFTAEAPRPHRVTNPGTGSAVFLVLQGVGEYDFVPVDTQSGPIS